MYRENGIGLRDNETLAENFLEDGGKVLVEIRGEGTWIPVKTNRDELLAGDMYVDLSKVENEWKTEWEEWAFQYDLDDDGEGNDGVGSARTRAKDYYRYNADQTVWEKAKAAAREDLLRYYEDVTDAMVKAEAYNNYIVEASGLYPASPAGDPFDDFGMQLLKSEHPDEWTQAQTLATAKMEKMYAASWFINVETDDYRWIKAMSGNENLLETIGNSQEAIAESLTTYGANRVKLKAATDDLADGDYSLDKASARSAAGRTNSSGSASFTTSSTSSFLSLNNHCMYLPGRANTARFSFSKKQRTVQRVCCFRYDVCCVSVQLCRRRKRFSIIHSPQETVCSISLAIRLRLCYDVDSKDKTSKDKDGRYHEYCHLR